MIDWATTQFNSSIMSVSIGVGLLLIIRFMKHLKKSKIGQLEGWSIGFAMPGFILTITGTHMSLNKPLSKIDFPYNQIIFSELSLAFGVLLLAVAILLWRKATIFEKRNIDYIDTITISRILMKEAPILLKPLSYFTFAIGLALLSISMASIRLHLFSASTEEPIYSALAKYPLVEGLFLSGLYALTGIGAILLPFTLKKYANSSKFKLMITCWNIAGIAFILYGVMNYFTHIGLVVHTLGN
ncbi:DUF981 family protein [Viridibacillus sp. NPDC096237]|uniref:DUF981 family protein n=1 Tax=Viridibacillus sp. NPDC096237 TaxID=3390721 RepID=UPI003D01E9EE